MERKRDEKDSQGETPMRTRIITKEDCQKCKLYLRTLRDQGIKFEIYKSEDPGHQENLDKWRIEDMPVVQIIDESDKILHQFPHGMFSSRAIKHKIKMLKENKK